MKHDVTWMGKSRGNTFENKGRHRYNSLDALEVGETGVGGETTYISTERSWMCFVPLHSTCTSLTSPSTEITRTL